MRAGLALLAALPLVAAAQATGGRDHDLTSGEPAAQALVQVDSGHRALVVTAGPFRLPAASASMAGMPHDMMGDTNLPVARFEWPLDTWVRGAQVKVVDGRGQPLPRQLLHHLTIENFDRRELVHPVAERLLSMGKETQDISLPRTVGIPMKAGQRLGVWVMWENDTGRELDSVFLRITLRWTAPNQVPRPINALPFHVDANLHVVGHNTFDVPPGGVSKIFEFTVPVGGHLLAASGHLHDHGVSLRLEDGETGKPLVTVTAKRDTEGHVLGVSRELLALRGQGPHLSARHRYRLVVRYDNPTADTLTDVMGIMGGLFAPDDIRRWPPINPQDSTYAADLRLLSPDQLPEGQAGAPAVVALDAMSHRSGTSGGRPVWRPVLLGSLSVVLTGFADEEIRIEVQRNGGPDARETGAEISHWSPPLALGIGAGLLGVGLGAHHPALARTGRDALVAMGVAGLLTTAVKIAVGRARPEANLGTDYFAPFRSPTHDNSFPSGHTSQAFSLAAVIAAHTRQPMLRFTVYGAAAVVGIARVAADRHFASDVVGGAILGTLVGRGVVHHFASGASRVGLAPMVAPGRVGLALNRRF